MKRLVGIFVLGFFVMGRKLWGRRLSYGWMRHAATKFHLVLSPVRKLFLAFLRNGPSFLRPDPSLFSFCVKCQSVVIGAFLACRSHSIFRCRCPIFSPCCAMPASLHFPANSGIGRARPIRCDLRVGGVIGRGQPITVIGRAQPITENILRVARRELGR